MECENKVCTSTTSILLLLFTTFTHRSLVTQSTGTCKYFSVDRIPVPKDSPVDPTESPRGPWSSKGGHFSRTLTATFLRGVDSNIFSRLCPTKIFSVCPLRRIRCLPGAYGGYTGGTHRELRPMIWIAKDFFPRSVHRDYCSPGRANRFAVRI